MDSPVTKIIAYCVFLRHAGIFPPGSGVNGAVVQERIQGELVLLWSEAEWPFEPSSLQRNAVEFHRVISHMFAQDAVVPFRLLSVFEDWRSLGDFMAGHQAALTGDLRRLRDVVQMECVLYFAPQPGGTPSRSRGDHPERKIELLAGTNQFVESMQEALGTISKEIYVRELKAASRIFVLVERGKEVKFHSIVQGLPVPQRLARKTSGPRPPTEFLSDAVKIPQITGCK